MSFVLPAALRLLFAALLGAATSFESAFGDLALPMLCVGGATLAAISAFAIQRSEGRVAAALPIGDAATMVLLLPCLSIVAMIGTSDSALGGGSGRFAAGALAIAFALLILRFALLLLNITEPGMRALTMLPAVLAVSVISVGGDRLSVDTMADGMRLAWGAAGLVTLVIGVTAPMLRRAVVVGAWVLVTGIALVVGQQSSGVSNGEVTAVGLLLALGSGALLLEMGRPAVQEPFLR